MREISIIKDSISWIKTWKTLPVFSWIIASKSLKAKDYKKAIRLYQKGLKSRKNHPARFCAMLDLASCYFELGKFEEAESILSKVATYIPKSKSARLKLINLQLWLGRYLDASWTLRRAVNTFANEPTFAALYLISVLENGTANFLLSEAVDIVTKLDQKAKEHPLVRTARAKLTLFHGDEKVAIKYIEKILEEKDAPLEAYHIAAGYYIEKGKIAKARELLNKALKLNNKHPKTLALFAKAYLASGPFYNEKYALQLALQANQNSGWLSPYALHILAEAYYHNRDIVSALLIATKARQEGKRLLGRYKEIEKLDAFIDSLKEQLENSDPKDFAA